VVAGYDLIAECRSTTVAVIFESSMGAKTHLPLKLADIITALGSVVRHRILLELAKGEPLPAYVVAQRVGITPNAASKQLLLLRDLGVLHRGYGDLYQIPARFYSEDKRALDFGAYVMRLDYRETAPE
jgi:DNA-binding transcriptional ArsR family regulator